MREIINDKRYGALKTLGERKQAFNEVTSAISNGLFFLVYIDGVFGSICC